MNRLLINSIALFSVGTTIWNCTPQKQEAEWPKILFIFGDDHATQAIDTSGPKHNNIANHMNENDLKLVPPGYFNKEQLARFMESYGSENEAFTTAKLQPMNGNFSI